MDNKPTEKKGVEDTKKNKVRITLTCKDVKVVERGIDL
jgi:hypothetical protein